MKIRTSKDDIALYIENREYTANQYAMNCFTKTMWVYSFSIVMNLLNIFIIDKEVIYPGYILSLCIYTVMYLWSKRADLSDKKTKCIILFGIIVVFTILGMTLTYHVVLVSILPLLFATLYSSKLVMRYVYGLTVVSTFVIVYGGYYFGLCDANMTLLTNGPLSKYVLDGRFTLMEINANPLLTLFLYFVVPRCLIYICFTFICNNLLKIVNGSLGMAKLTVELEKAKEDAENANQSKSQFLANMSHEIRTPINAVLGMNEMILRESREPQIYEYAKEIRNAAKSLLGLINDILDITKIEAGKLTIVPGEYRLSEMIKDINNMIGFKAEAKGLDFIVEIDSNLPSTLFGDEIRIKQILVNLLNNAVKYTHKGSITFEVKKMRNEIFYFAIKDTGIGIKQEDLERLYMPYERFEEARNHKIEGTGLGLTITRQLLDMMGSELGVKSIYGEGSVFSFVLEQEVIDATPIGNLEFDKTAEISPEKYRGTYIAPEAKVLVVDDNRINRQVLINLIKETQVQIDEAADGLECLDCVNYKQYDLIFLDHMMPGMDGVETLQEIQKQGLCGSTPIIMLTANAMVGEREKYIAMGFDDFLSKPILPEKLEQMMLQYLPKQKLHREEGSGIARIEEKKEERSELPQLEEFDFDYARNIIPKDEMLWKLLEEFCTSLKPLYDKLSNLFCSITEEESRKNYRIEVHALKSTSATVGALLLSKLARLLEVAAGEADYERLFALHPILLDEIEKHKERIRSIIPEEEEKAFSDGVDMAYLEMLKISLENEDYKTADFVCEELMKYRYKDEVQTQMDQLAEQIFNLEQEEALRTIDEIRGLGEKE